MKWVRRRKQRLEREQAPDVAVRRARMMGSGDLSDWADACLYAVGRSLSEARKTEDPERSLDLIDNALSETRVLLALVVELDARARGRTHRDGPSDGLYG